MAKTAAAAMKGGQLKDFSGGPNFRDSPPELAANECIDAWNVTFDERGGASSRHGYVKQNTPAFGGGSVHNIYWSPLLGARITQAGASLYLADTNTIRKTFTTEATVTFAELNSRVIAAHPADGLFTSTDGITWTAVADIDAPTTGTCLAVWQNKLFVGLPDGSIHWCVAGDPTNWAPTDFNKIWEKDQQPIVALHIGSGQDILGHAGLLVFKQESAYRIYDSATGAYTTVDATVGAAGPLAVVGVGAKVITLSKRGIFWWQNGQIGMVNASDRFLHLWQPDQVNLGTLSLWCAGRKGNRALFSLARATVNDLALEFHPEQGWLAPRSDAMSCYCTSTGAVEAVYGGSVGAAGQVYKLETGGSDDGAPIAGRFQTRWVELNGGFQTSIWQLRLHGRGKGTLTVRTDYASGGGNAEPFDLSGSTSVTYDSGLHYDTPGLVYYIPAYQASEAHYDIGVCRQFSLLFTWSSSLTATGPQVLGAGVAPTVGYFGLSGVEWMYVPLGLS